MFVTRRAVVTTDVCPIASIGARRLPFRNKISTVFELFSGRLRNRALGSLRSRKAVGYRLESPVIGPIVERTQRWLLALYEGLLV